MERLKIYEDFYVMGYPRKSTRKIFGYDYQDIRDILTDLMDDYPIDIFVEFKIGDFNKSRNIEISVKFLSEDVIKSEFMSAFKEECEKIDGYSFLEEIGMSGALQRTNLDTKKMTKDYIEMDTVITLREDAWFKKIDKNFKPVKHNLTTSDFRDIFKEMEGFGIVVRKLFSNSERTSTSEKYDREHKFKFYHVSIQKKYEQSLDYPDLIHRAKPFFLNGCKELELIKSLSNIEKDFEVIGNQAGTYLLSRFKLSFNEK